LSVQFVSDEQCCPTTDGSAIKKYCKKCCAFGFPRDYNKPMFI
jgi:hypothetical protein